MSWIEWLAFSGIDSYGEHTCIELFLVFGLNHNLHNHCKMKHFRSHFHSIRYSLAAYPQTVPPKRRRKTELEVWKVAAATRKNALLLLLLYVYTPTMSSVKRALSMFEFSVVNMHRSPTLGAEFLSVPSFSHPKTLSNGPCVLHFHKIWTCCLFSAAFSFSFFSPLLELVFFVQLEITGKKQEQCSAKQWFTKRKRDEKNKRTKKTVLKTERFQERSAFLEEKNIEYGKA